MLPHFVLTHLVPQFSTEIEERRLRLFSRHDVASTIYDEVLERASLKMERKYASYYPGKHWSFEDALARMREFCSDTSPGWMWSRQGYATKRAVIEDPVALSRVYASVSAYMAGRFQWLPWSDALKDELLKKAKVDSGDTRLFVVSPPEHYLASAIVFGAFQANIFDRWKHLNSCCAGATLEYGGYLQILERFKYKTRFYSSDAKHQDVSISPVLAWYALKPLIMCMPEVFRSAAFVLVTEMLYCAVISSGGYVVLKQGGNPSGGFLTLLLNILVQELLWTAYHDESKCLCDPAYAIVGDDNMLGTHDGCSLLDQTAVLSFFQQFGLTLELHPVTDSLLGLEWCGKTLEVRSGLVSIVPRENKMKSATFFAKHRNPLMVVSRLIGIYKYLFETDFEPALRKLIEFKIEKHNLNLKIPSIYECMLLRYGRPVRLNISRFKIHSRFVSPGVVKEACCLVSESVSRRQ